MISSYCMLLCRMGDFNSIRFQSFARQMYANYFCQSIEENTKLLIKWMMIESISDSLFSKKMYVISIYLYYNENH